MENLKLSWDDEKRNFQTLLSETKKTTEDERRLALQKMKMQYLETLRKIRDEIRESKAKNAEAMEKEWRRRKEELGRKLASDFELRY